MISTKEVSNGSDVKRSLKIINDYVILNLMVGVGAARAGNLTFMVGGVEQEFDAAKELLTCMGSNVVYCGEVGTGQVNVDHS